MPKVATYEQGQVRTQLTSQPLAQQAPSAAFGGQIAKGLSDVVAAGVDLKKRIDTTSAEEALTKFERSKNDIFFNPDGGYFNLQGKDAYDKSADTTKALDDLKMQYGETLSPEAKALFDKAADAHITRSKADISRHAAKGLKVWEISTIEAQVENSVENAALYWNDPERLSVQRELGRQAVMDSARMSGISPEATAEKLQTFESTFAKSTVTSAIQSSSVEGEKALEKYGDRLEGPDKMKLEAEITKKKEVEKTKEDARLAVLKSTNLVNRYDDRQSIIDEVNTIEDPDLRKKTMTEAMAQLSRKQQAEKERQGNYYNAGIEHFNRGGTAEEFKAQNPEAWAGMSEQQRNNLLTGKHMITDQVLFHDLMLKSPANLAKENTIDYIDKLAPADLNKLDSAIKAARKGQSITQLQTPAQKVQRVAEEFFGKKSTWPKSKEKTESIEQLMTAAQNEIQAEEEAKNRKLTPTEMDDVLARFSRDYVIERSATIGGMEFDWLASDLNINIKTTPPEKVNSLSKYVERFGEDTLTQVTDALKKNGKPVTIDNILGVYEQVK